MEPASPPRLEPLWRRVLRAPALRAALVQALAFPLMLVSVYLLARAGRLVLPWHAALLQGALAAGFSVLLRQAPWWRAIHLLFPLALCGADALQLPPVLFLLVFLLLLALYWSTFRTQVPYYPSGQAARDAVLALLPAQSGVQFIDIGSGFGGMVLELARRRPDATCHGIELAPLPWLCSCLRARWQGGAARFVRGDYETLDFAAYDVVFAYLSPAAMEALWRKANCEMRPGTMLLSYEFTIPARRPDKTIAATPGAPALYVWRF